MSQKKQFMEQFCFRVMLCSAILCAIAYVFKDQLPEPYFYNNDLLTPPVQQPTDTMPFQIDEHGESYLITPKYDYELSGMVVTYNDASQLGNIWHHKRWKDFINVRDLCVIWGDNVHQGAYQH